MGLSNLPENRLQQNEDRYGVYYLEPALGEEGETLEATVYKNGSVQIIGGLVQDKPIKLSPAQAKQLNAILVATPAGGPVTRGAQHA